MAEDAPQSAKERPRIAQGPPQRCQKVPKECFLVHLGSDLASQTLQHGRQKGNKSLLKSKSFSVLLFSSFRLRFISFFDWIFDAKTHRRIKEVVLTKS